MHRNRRIFLNFASKWIKNQKTNCDIQKLQDKHGQELFKRMLNKNMSEENDGDFGPLKINEKINKS